MTPTLLALAVAVLWWPATEPERRLADLACRRRRRGRSWYLRIVIALIPLTLWVSGGWTVAAVGAIIGASVIRATRRRRRERADAAATAELLTALSAMISELEVGAPPPRACAVAAGEVRRRDGGSGAESDVAHGLTTMAGRAELGGDVWGPADADDMDALSWQRIGRAWRTADRCGLPMVDLLRSLRSDVLARKQFRERTRAGLAGPRATATVLAGLPLLGIALGQAIGARPLSVLLSPGLGGVLCVVGTGLAAAGLAWSQHITDKVLR